MQFGICFFLAILINSDEVSTPMKFDFFTFFLSSLSKVPVAQPMSKISPVKFLIHVFLISYLLKLFDDVLIFINLVSLDLGSFHYLN